MPDSELDFETRAAQTGLYMRVGDVISTVAPINASTTFAYESVQGVHDALAPGGEGFAYSRNANPTVVALEQAMASLEGAAAVVAFGSGMAAIHAALLGSGLQAGDRVVAATDLYGVTRALLTQLADFDIETDYVDVMDPPAVGRALAQRSARVLLFESISNPLLRVADTRALVDLAHGNRATVVMDNTFATPYLFRPLAWGVDLVVHSATKYIAGHGDVMAGLVATGRDPAPLRAIRTTSGGVLSPFEAWLTMRGIRTLPLRAERQSASALEIARFLQGKPWIKRVYYPGLHDYPQHDIARRQFGDMFGGMVAFDLNADQAATLRFMDALALIQPATSLGDASSLVLYPALSSHRTLSAEQKAATGIGEGLVRMSVGLESPRDLMADLARAAVAAGITRAREGAAAG